MRNMISEDQLREDLLKQAADKRKENEIAKIQERIENLKEISNEENQEQIKRFLTTETGKSFTFVKETKILAQETGFDGFYMALLERKKEI